MKYFCLVFNESSKYFYIIGSGHCQQRANSRLENTIHRKYLISRFINKL